MTMLDGHNFNRQIHCDLEMKIRIEVLIVFNWQRRDAAQ